MSDSLLSAALDYPSFGFAVFPGHSIAENGVCTCGRSACSSPAKHPRIKEWQVKASKDPATIERWWNRWPTANVCIATGAISGVVVLDIDPRHGGDDSLRDLEERHGRLAATVTALTGSGGQHLYFRHPGQQVSNRTNLYPGIDVRGDGGFVVAPPSSHVSGGVYRWA